MTKIFFVIKNKLNVLNWEIWRDLERDFVFVSIKRKIDNWYIHIKNLCNESLYALTILLCIIILNISSVQLFFSDQISCKLKLLTRVNHIHFKHLKNYHPYNFIYVTHNFNSHLLSVKVYFHNIEKMQVSI